jgi:hypothetical protein
MSSLVEYDKNFFGLAASVRRTAIIVMFHLDAQQQSNLDAFLARSSIAIADYMVSEGITREMARQHWAREVEQVLHVAVIPYKFLTLGQVTTRLGL